MNSVTINVWSIETLRQFCLRVNSRPFSGISARHCGWSIARQRNRVVARHCGRVIGGCWVRVVVSC